MHVVAVPWETRHYNTLRETQDYESIMTARSPGFELRVVVQGRSPSGVSNLCIRLHKTSEVANWLEMHITPTTFRAAFNTFLNFAQFGDEGVGVLERSLLKIIPLTKPQTIEVSYRGVIYLFEDQTAKNSVKIVQTFGANTYWYAYAIGSRVTVFDIWRNGGEGKRIYLLSRPQPFPTEKPRHEHHNLYLTLDPLVAQAVVQYDNKWEPPVEEDMRGIPIRLAEGSAGARGGEGLGEQGAIYAPTTPNNTLLPELTEELAVGNGQTRSFLRFPFRFPPCGRKP